MNQIELDEVADRLIAYIRKRPGHFFDWQRLTARLRIDLETLNRAIDTAVSWDYRLRMRRSKGVAFVEPPDSLTATEIKWNLKTKWLGQTVCSYRSVRSTNDLATQMAESGAPEGVLVTAEEQTRGRGRLGRSWHSPSGTGIYLSVILRPRFKPEEAPGISIMTAVTLAETISIHLPGKVQLKWPNDVLIRGRKTAGILTELTADRRGISHLLVGVGINVNQRAVDFPAELRKSATSLRRELKHKVSRVELLRLFLRNLERQYEIYLKHRLKKSHAKIRRYSSLIGQHVTVQSGRSRLDGLAIDINLDGCLILETSSGRIPITAGEVTVVKE